MYHPIVKEQVIPGQLEGLQAIRNYSDVPFPCQAISTNPQAHHPPFTVEIAGCDSENGRRDWDTVSPTRSNHLRNFCHNYPSLMNEESYISNGDKAADALAVLHKEIDGCLRCSGVAGFEKPEHLDRGDAGDVMVVGQGPGRAEITGGRAFAGQSGRRLDSWLIQSGADPANPRHGIYFTSVIKCCHSHDPDFPHMADNCGGFLQRQIEILHPKLVISLGKQAYMQLRFTAGEYDGALCVPVRTSEYLLVSRVGFDFWLLPWPHPSGLNRWHNAAENRSQLEASFQFLRPFLRRQT